MLFRPPITVEDAENESMGSCASAQSNYSSPDCLQRFKGMYVEEFPETLAGAPVSNQRVPPLDLDAYMKTCRPMAKLEHFEVAELLMTSGMSNVAKDRHLRSRMVSSCFCRVHGKRLTNFVVQRPNSLAAL
jgi:hypothetical protein